MTSHVVVGRYRLDALVRPGVDGSTWHGTDVSTGERVRVCLVASETGAAARSRRSLHHPGLVPIREVARLRDGVLPPLVGPDPRGDTLVVLDAPPGPTLTERVEMGALDLSGALAIALQVGDAVSAIEDVGSVHGSVNPDAIICPRGQPARLGLAGVSDAVAYFSSPARSVGGGPSTHDDAWALLASLYFAISGTRPFEAESPAALVRRILGGRPVPIRQPTPRHAALQQLFDRGFSRTASTRFVSVAVLVADLRALPDEDGGLPAPPEVSPRAVTATTARRKASADVIAATRAPTSDRPTEGAIPSARISASTLPPPGPERGGDRLAPDLPQAGSPKQSARAMTRPFDDEPPALRRRPSHTMPFGSTPTDDRPGTTLRPVGSAVAPPPVELDMPLPPRVVAPPVAAPTPQKPLDRTEPGTPDAKVDTIPAPPPSAAPSAAPRVAEEPRRVRASDFPPAEDTRRFEREQIEQVWRETARKTSERPPPGDGSLVDTRPSHTGAPPRPATDVAAAPARAPLPPASSPASRLVPMLAVVAVGALAVMAWALSTRSSSGGSASATTSAPPPTSTPSTPAETATAKPAPPPAASSRPAATASAPPATGSADACVRAHYPEGSFDSNGDASFVCEDLPLIKMRDKLQRALVAGSRGRGITPAMREYALYRWFELPAVATLRAACCPNPTPPAAPKLSGACSSPTETVWTLALAASTKGADLDAPSKQYRRMAACMLGSGEAGIVGQTDAMTGGEESAFRALVERSRARAP